MRGLVATKGAGEIGLDLLLRRAAVLLAELHADARRPLALCALGRQPDDAPRDRKLLLLAHQVEEHEDLVAEPITAVGRDEEPAILHERHIREIEGALVLDRERQETRLRGWCPHFHQTALSPDPPGLRPTRAASETARPSKSSCMFSGPPICRRASRNWSSRPKPARIFVSRPGGRNHGNRLLLTTSLASDASFKLRVSQLSSQASRAPGEFPAQ